MLMCYKPGDQATLSSDRTVYLYISESLSGFINRLRLSVNSNLTGGGNKFEWRAFKRLSRELESF